MLKPNHTVLPMVARPKASRSEPAAESPPVFCSGLDVMDRAARGGMPTGAVARGSAPRSTQPAAAGVAASAGISNFGLDLRRAGGRPADGTRGDSLVPDIVFSAC